MVKMIVSRFRSATFNSLGVTLIETVVALSIFASAGTAVLLGVSAAHNSSAVVNASSVAENLARNQMEYVWTKPFLEPLDTYDNTDFDVAIPLGYAVSADATFYEVDGDVVEDDLDGCIQKVVVTVLRDGVVLHVLETLRSDPNPC